MGNYCITVHMDKEIAKKTLEAINTALKAVHEILREEAQTTLEKYLTTQAQPLCWSGCACDRIYLGSLIRYFHKLRLVPLSSAYSQNLQLEPREKTLLEILEAMPGDENGILKLPGNHADCNPFPTLNRRFQRILRSFRGLEMDNLVWC